MQQEAENELRIMLINGRRMQFMSHELRGFLTSPQLLLILLTVLMLLVAVDPYVFPHPINLPARTLFWMLALIIYLGSMLLVGWLFGLVAPLFKIRWPYLPLVDIPIVTLATVAASYIGPFFTGEQKAHLDLDLAAFIRNYMLAQGLQFILMNWAFADFIRRERGGKAGEAQEPSDAVPRDRRSLSANSRTVLIDQLISLEAKQHYVDIRTRTGTFTVRSTMKALLGQLSDEDGIQIHRCFWVSSWAISRMSGGASKRIVHLFDGTTLPVSRPRSEAVEAWFNAHTISETNLADKAEI